MDSSLAKVENSESDSETEVLEIPSESQKKSAINFRIMALRQGEVIEELNKQNSSLKRKVEEFTTQQTELIKKLKLIEEKAQETDDALQNEKKRCKQIALLNANLHWRTAFLQVSNFFVFLLGPFPHDIFLISEFYNLSLYR